MEPDHGFRGIQLLPPNVMSQYFLNFFLHRLRLLLLCSANTISVVPQSKCKRKRYHKETEKWYRLRLRLLLRLLSSANTLVKRHLTFRTHTFFITESSVLIHLLLLEVYHNYCARVVAGVRIRADAIFRIDTACLPNRC
jgi:hypothetical protein